jgi:multidrug resistance efflux pump
MSSYQYTVLEKVSLHRFVEKFWHITFVIFLVILAFLFLPWQQTVKGTGIISAYDPTQRPYAVSATINGFIDEFHVEENQFVKKGDLLFTMVDLDRKYSAKLKNIEVKSQEQLQNTQKQILLSEEKKENLKEYLEIGLKVYAQKFAQTEDKIRSLRLKKVSLEKNHEIEKLNFERIALLYKDGIESKRKYDSMENIYILKQKRNWIKLISIFKLSKKILILLGKRKRSFLKTPKTRSNLLTRLFYHHTIERHRLIKTCSDSL